MYVAGGLTAACQLSHSICSFLLRSSTKQTKLVKNHILLNAHLLRSFTFNLHFRLPQAKSEIADKTSWWCLPPEIQNEIVGLLPIAGGKCSQLATVSRTWRSIIEPLNFAEISLTVPRLSDPDSRAILFRKGDYIRYIWFRMGLRKYEDKYNSDLNEPRGDLTLDISVYSPDDNQYLSFCSDTDLDECPSIPGHIKERTSIDDTYFDWNPPMVWDPYEISANLSGVEIMGEGPFGGEELEMQWWRNLPLVLVVGVLLLRQQTRRRWKPVAFANMLTRFPNMKELCYEPWLRSLWHGTQDYEGIQTLFESFPSTKLCKLTIFENFNETWRISYSQSTESGHQSESCSRQPVPHDAVRLFHGRRRSLLRSASIFMDLG
ncbi:hypothetical protein FVEN_g3552 [Fusarium venenatum]|nr:hypothetical protein FVEN_g3552 [Fusarium venenatum]